MAAASPTWSEQAKRLLEQALFLRMYGERPPGAPPWPGETWRDWDTRAEAFLRGCDADSLARKIAYLARLWGGGTAGGMAEAERILADSPVLTERLAA